MDSYRAFFAMDTAFVSLILELKSSNRFRFVVLRNGDIVRQRALLFCQCLHFFLSPPVHFFVKYKIVLVAIHPVPVDCDWEKFNSIVNFLYTKSKLGQWI